MPSPDSFNASASSLPVVQFPSLTPPRNSGGSPSETLSNSLQPPQASTPARPVGMQRSPAMMAATPSAPGTIGSGCATVASDTSTSIWRERRPSSLAFNAQSARNSARARAGTLPSRLQTSTTPEVTEQLGSLALLSPNTDQMPAESQSIGRLGRHMNTRSDAGLRPFPSLLSSRSRGTSPFPAAPISETPLVSSVPPPTGPDFEVTEASVASSQIRPRKRSGSLNSLASNTAFSPFAPSIWNSGSAHAGLPSSSPENLHQQPYLPASATPSRLRSRTFGTSSSEQYSVLPPPTPQHLGIYGGRGPAAYGGINPVGAVGGPVPRSRASTVSSSGARHRSPSSGVALGGYTAQSLNDIPDSYVVTVDDLSPTPTLCLWINNVAPSATLFSLHTLFSQYGRVEGARVLPSCNSAFVKFADLQSAIDAQHHTNTIELYPGHGPSLVGFVKGVDGTVPPPPPPTTAVTPAGPAVLPPSATTSQDMFETLSALGASPSEIESSMAMVARAKSYTKYESETHPLPELADRIYVSAVLRDVRKRIDNDSISREEIEELALAMMVELPVLASDYMGNTVVQQLFDHCSTVFRDMMLRELQPYLAQTGVHKNGTWAAQKIIDVASTAREYAMISDGVRPFVVPLFLDQYGNYVIQCCLKFGAPWNDFIFEAIAAKMPEIAQGRFGARAIRACLESPHTSKQQQRLVAATIIENSAMLSTNANGSLLVSWLLDTYTAPARFGLVTRRLLRTLGTIASSKLGSQVLLKIIANRVDTQSTRQILDVLLDLGSDSPTPILESLLQDTVNGPMFLFKLLNTGLAEYSLERQVAVNKIRMLLLRPNAVIPTHKRLLEEVGLAMLAPSEDRSLSPPRSDAPSNGGDVNMSYQGVPPSTMPSGYQEWLRY